MLGQAVLGHRAPGQGGPGGDCGHPQPGAGTDPLLVELGHCRLGRAGQPISGADVAEFAHAGFGQNGIRLRLIVRRVHPTPGRLLALFTESSYRAWSWTARAPNWSWRRTIAARSRWGRSPAISRKGRVWPTCRRAVRRQGCLAGIPHHGPQPGSPGAGPRPPEKLPALTTTGRLRVCLFSVPGRRIRPARRNTLHLPPGRPRQGMFLSALRQIRLAT